MEKTPILTMSFSSFSVVVPPVFMILRMWKRATKPVRRKLECPAPGSRRGHQHETRERRRVHTGHVTEPGQLIPRHLAQGQDNNGLGLAGPRPPCGVAAMGSMASWPHFLPAARNQVRVSTTHQSELAMPK